MDLIKRAAEWNKNIGIKTHDELLAEAKKLISDFCEAVAVKLPEEVVEEEPITFKKK